MLNFNRLEYFVELFSMSSKFLFCWSIQSNPFWTKWCLFVLSLSCHIVCILVTLSALSHPVEAFRNISCLPWMLGCWRWVLGDGLKVTPCVLGNATHSRSVLETYSKMFLPNLIGVFAHDEVDGPKQNVKINLNAFAIKSFNRNTVDQTVHGEKFVKFVLFWTTFYWILGFILSMLLSCFYWNIDYRKSIRFYDINHYHKPRARIESWKKKHGGFGNVKILGPQKKPLLDLIWSLSQWEF